MNLLPRRLKRPLMWPDVVLDLQHLLADSSFPIYVVGGAVRDAYLRRPIKDIDLATPEESIPLARLIANRLHGDVFVLDAERGVARVLINLPNGRLTMDVARFRGDDLTADLYDRDFTINAMAVNLVDDLDALIDPINGEADATNKLIRRCTPHSISDDPIRALRAVRQSVQLGMRIERETIADIRSSGPRLADTSPERLRDELVNLLNVKKPAPALRAAASLGLLEIVVPETRPMQTLPSWEHILAVIERLGDILSVISPTRTDNSAASFHLGTMVMQLDRFRARLQGHMGTVWPNDRPHRALLMLGALLYPCDDVDSRRFRFSNAEDKRLMTIIRHSLRLPETDNRSIHRFWYPLGEAGVDICLLALAEFMVTDTALLDQDAWLGLVDRVRILLEAYYEHYDELVVPPPYLDGNQLIQALKLQPGPIISTLIDLIREEQAVGTVRSAEDAIRVARTYLDEHT